MSPATRRWTVVTAACSVLAAAIASTASHENIPCYFGVCDFEPGHSLRVRANVTTSNIRRLATGYRDAADLALAARVLPRGRPAGEPELWFAPDVAETARLSIRAALDSHRVSRGAWHGKGRVAVMVVSDTAGTLAGRSLSRSSASIDVRALLPTPETDGRCVAVIRLRGSALTSRVEWNPARPLLDACSFFDAFGEPGASIRATLDSGAFSAARLYLPAAPDSLRRQRHRSAALGIDRGEEGETYRCSTGQMTQCDSLVLRGASHRRALLYYYWATMPPATQLPVTIEGNGWWGGALMDAIAANLGPAQFARFWQSSEPMDRAYQAIAGHSIGRVAYESIRGAGLWRERRRPGGFGMRAETTWPARIASSALALLAIATLVAAARLSRRPVTA